MNLSKKRLYDSALTEKGFNISMKYIPRNASFKHKR